MKYVALIIGLSLLFVGCESSSKPTQSTNSAPQPAQEAVNAPSVSKEDVVQESAMPTDEPTQMTGEMIYTQKCASCHGQQGERKALGTSQIISTFSEQSIIDALKGYKEGTYGGERKMLMAPHAKALSDEDIANVSRYISEL